MGDSIGSSQRAGPRRFPGRLQFRCPPALIDILTTAAEKEMITPSAYLRRAVADRLRADGFELRVEA